MKTFLLIPLVVTLFQACSSQSAFSHFDITQEQAKSEEIIQSSKITQKQDIVGVVTTLYLNPIDSEKYEKYEYFYVTLYLKKNEKYVKFLLNGEEATESKLLPNKNNFSKLLHETPLWSKNYLLLFPKREGESVLRFKIESKDASSQEMHFNRDE